MENDLPRFRSPRNIIAGMTHKLLRQGKTVTWRFAGGGIQVFQPKRITDASGPEQTQTEHDPAQEQSET
ncbi:MAG: hypothetical protein ABL932_15095 [Terricaulis sp.]